MDSSDELVIKNTGKGYDWFGPCERCGKRCDLHYKQWRKSPTGHSIAGFGHIECLKTGEFKDAKIDHSV